MARKVFISFLGASFYSQCYYGKENYFGEGLHFKSSESRFVQQATLEYLGANQWQDSDAAYFLLTEQAKTDNWDESITQRINNRTKQIEEYIGLERIIKEMNLPFKARAIDIPNVKNENEIWEIFKILISDDADDGNPIIRKDDELYFDLTHGYRYLPMLMLVFGNYMKFLKHVKICSITYGNIEKKDPSTNIAPIYNLLPLSDLQDWTFAIADYLENGNFNRLKSLSDKSLMPIRKNEATRDKGVEIKKLTDGLKIFADELKTCRGINIIESKSITNVLDQLSKIEKSNTVLPALLPLFDMLKASLVPFSKEQNVSNCFAAAQWCYDNQQYQAAITFLEEGIISFLCEEFQFDKTDKNLRDLFSYANTMQLKNSTKWEDELEEDRKNLMREIIQHPLFKKKGFLWYFYNIIDLRNDYNHCGMRKKDKNGNGGPRATKIIIDNIKNYIAQANHYINYRIHSDTINYNLLFLNLSNHPSTNWSEEQLTAARIFGEIKDLPFPNIDESLDETGIEALTDDYLAQIKELSGGEPCTVHIMGEMTFTYALVNKLKAAGYTCVASTSIRDVELLPDGSKQVKFHFCRFRKY